MIKELLTGLGIIFVVNLTYNLQLKWGNFLYELQYKNKLGKFKFLRKIWWSEFDFYRDYEFEKYITNEYIKKNS